MKGRIQTFKLDTTELERQPGETEQNEVQWTKETGWASSSGQRAKKQDHSSRPLG